MLANKKIAFFGTPNFTVDFLELFKNLGLDISLVVTGEDRPVGRGMQMHSPSPKLWAKENNINFLQPQKLDEEFFNFLSSLHEKKNFDLFIVIAYGKIIPEKVINLPKHGTINLHYSLLPKYRGASPIESAILNGDIETGISIQQMVYKLDAGNILFQETQEIFETETATDLRNKLNQRAIEIFPEFLNNFFDRKTGNLKQDETEATNCGKFTKQDLDVTKDLESKNLEIIYKKFKAFDKRIYFFHVKQNGELLRTKITDMTSSEILKLLPESKKEIALSEFEKAFGKII